MEELKTLFLRAQAGDLSAYGEVVRRFQDMAVGYAYAILGDFHLAEDAAQEAFIEAYASLEKVYSPFSFPAWLRKIIFKHCDRLTRGRHYQTVPIETALRLASAGPDPSEAAEANEMRDRVREAIQGLPEHERRAVILFYIADHSQDEIAAFLGVPVTTVKKRLHDARRRLRERMMDMVQETLSAGAPSRNEGFTSKVLEGVQLFARGKVRDVYDLDDRLLIVATDRISAYDCVMPNDIPDKGKILTAMSLFWFNLTRDIVQNHLITADVGKYPEPLRRFADQLEGRSMLVRKAKRIDLECVVRGYLAGSGWKEYRATNTVCGIRLPPGLRESERLPETIFTPATKADTGHDENISFEQAAELVGEALARKLREISIAIYQKARDYADGRGILIADTKFEFGLIDGEIILIDEILSPDSSRFWPKDRYEPGRPQDSFDKQFVRDYLDTLDWDKTPPAPALPDEIVRKTAEKYREAYQKLVTD